MVSTYQINALTLQTGDIICTMNGKPDILPGEFWRLIGRLVPGDVDHIAIYLGPEGRCIESGSLGVVTFDVHDGCWDPGHALPERGLLVDSFYGASYPLDGLELSEAEETQMRFVIADYCLAQIGKPYNLNFLNSEREDAFYCSQLAYKAYQRVGINLNTGQSVPNVPGTSSIIFPQEIWAGSAHKRAILHNPMIQPKM